MAFGDVSVENDRIVGLHKVAYPGSLSGRYTLPSDVWLVCTGPDRSGVLAAIKGRVKGKVEALYSTMNGRTKDAKGLNNVEHAGARTDNIL